MVVACIVALLHYFVCVVLGELLAPTGALYNSLRAPPVSFSSKSHTMAERKSWRVLRPKNDSNLMLPFPHRAPVSHDSQPRYAALPV